MAENQEEEQEVGQQSFKTSANNQVRLLSCGKLY
jgi:hypothetical protein